jgi:uncharacterized protein YegJ (DUF2314 family)
MKKTKKLKRLERKVQELHQDLNILLKGSLVKQIGVRLKYRIADEVEDMIWRVNKTKESEGFLGLLNNVPNENTNKEM